MRLIITFIALLVLAWPVKAGAPISISDTSWPHVYGGGSTIPIPSDDPRLTGDLSYIRGVYAADNVEYWEFADIPIEVREYWARLMDCYWTQLGMPTTWKRRFLVYGDYPSPNEYGSIVDKYNLEMAKPPPIDYCGHEFDVPNVPMSGGWFLWWYYEL